MTDYKHSTPIIRMPGGGPPIATTEFVYTNRTGAVVLPGDLVMVDTFGADPDSTDWLNFGSQNHPLQNVVAIPDPAVAAGVGSITTAPGGGLSADFVVVTDLLGNAGADNKQLRASPQGIIRIAVDATVASAGAFMKPKLATRTLTPQSTTAGAKCVAQLLEATAAAGLRWCRFDGENGLSKGVFLS